MIKKILLFLITIVIIVFSFVMPGLFLHVEDLSRENEIFTRPKKETKKIDVQAEKIYLVMFIHNIYQIKNEQVYDVDKNKTITYVLPRAQTRKATTPTEEFKNEVSKLVSSEIMNEINLDEYLHYMEVEDIFSPEYTVISCSMEKENAEWIGTNIEEKTGKIISADFPKSFLKTGIEIEKQLRNYAKYLDLDIIDDWKFENNILKSEKAQLSIMLVESGESCLLTIAPIEIYEEYVAEDETIKREYEIVEREIENRKK